MIVAQRYDFKIIDLIFISPPTPPTHSLKARRISYESQLWYDKQYTSTQNRSTLKASRRRPSENFQGVLKIYRRRQQQVRDGYRAKLPKQVHCAFYNE